jgi:hypothetical protein
MSTHGYGFDGDKCAYAAATNSTWISIAPGNTTIERRLVVGSLGLAAGSDVQW